MAAAVAVVVVGGGHVTVTIGLIQDVPSFFQSNEDALMFAHEEGRLDSLPHLQHSAEYFRSLKVNKQIQTFVYHCLITVRPLAADANRSPWGHVLFLQQVNESLSQLYLHTQSFRQHVDWLKSAKENVSLPSQSAEGTSKHLLQLSNLLKASLQQVRGVGFQIKRGHLTQFNLLMHLCSFRLRKRSLRRRRPSPPRPPALT